MTKLDELQNKVLDICEALATATNEYGIAVTEYWKAEHEYRKAKAFAFTRHVSVKFDGKKPTDAHLSAMVDVDCEDERFAERMAKGKEKALQQRIYALQAMLTGAQSALKKEVEEASLLRLNSRNA